ncbi:hypothetical protein L195_g024625, partial [Trifolium pratense]
VGSVVIDAKLDRDDYGSIPATAIGNCEDLVPCFFGKLDCLEDS